MVPDYRGPSWLFRRKLEVARGEWSQARLDPGRLRELPEIRQPYRLRPLLAGPHDGIRPVCRRLCRARRVRRVETQSEFPGVAWHSRPHGRTGVPSICRIRFNSRVVAGIGTGRYHDLQSE